MSDFQAYNEASQHLNILRNTVALVEIALNDAAEGDKQVAPHVLAAVLYGTQHHLDTLEQLTTCLFQTTAHKPQPVPDPGTKLTGLLRTMRQEAADAEERGHEIMPSALTHYAHLFEEALAASQMQSEVSHG
ncbi:MAG TPA: hypothetical protein DCX51_04585 [Halomonas sp.]|jgi:hypothetical protein|uniref:Uncharacterized protein n=1 Tax=Vreelandella aquamarina TaxID=77097 RepID=A0A6F8SQB0_9GAMM|nr:MULTISPECIES: hypothetical protein [Halomonas]KTG25240.1 hypothetical protein AUR68_21465 [Idiomarina sp. H105]MEC8900807.1 hypothetical protein [Pseudomonadota bacterium]OAE95102.1 hypothetical protein AWR38_21490 [Idiomarina sp. WRN-38]MCC4292485.1 hypothetical protein [Halomonas axialensis]MCF2911702.1 hypothetical protein [Halomonas sp. Cn5-12]|tara:strand:+ start:83 stop:478 length:396 start_codon:yes stop_codon:yes gene_type:complete